MVELLELLTMLKEPEPGLDMVLDTVQVSETVELAAMVDSNSISSLPQKVAVPPVIALPFESVIPKDIP